MPSIGKIIFFITEPVSKRSTLYKVKPPACRVYAPRREGKNFNRRRHEVSTLVNILNISRIKN
jgi:hypothetical protein